MRIIGDIGNYCLTSEGLKEGPCPYDELQVPSLGYGSFEFVYGPSAGGLLESTAFIISTYGEDIEAVKNAGYKLRQIKVTNMPLNESIIRVERINANFAASHTISLLSAIEKATETEVPQKVIEARIAQLELERIRNHLLVIQRELETASFLVPNYLLLQQIEETNRAISKSCGHRYFFGANSLGEIRCELVLPRLKLKEINDILENRIFIDRLQGNGKIIESYAIGPAARAAGLEYDARLEVEELGYKDLDLKLVKEEEGDAFARILVRLREIEESYRLLQEIKVSPVKYEVKSKDGCAIGRVESPSGDLAYYLKMRSGVIEQVHLLPPSKINMRLFLKSMPGNIFTDFAFNWESFGIWLSEIEVDLK
ncbi:MULTISPECIES: hypothetical protein [Metallosphaera]|uniref:NADH-ubiquinone oxidoreductase, chain 49kDa n=1 Tax=Metallosphaera cuprina (strain Ar-4) TaxID=1006006 RepID=F4G264_METCR|nr:hypothetical protein [Metallosphaera cuprina]AEB94912.1 NADH-ubiquinone oxidoreductase, chain 49kDa [Metallosphaera cuprina Ar-4]